MRSLRRRYGRAFRPRGTGRWVRTPNGTIGEVIEEQGKYGARRRLLRLASGAEVWVHGQVYDVPSPKDQP
jgi:hypothetical protein